MCARAPLARPLATPASSCGAHRLWPEFTHLGGSTQQLSLRPEVVSRRQLTPQPPSRRFPHPGGPLCVGGGRARAVHAAGGAPGRQGGPEVQHRTARLLPPLHGCATSRERRVAPHASTGSPIHMHIQHVLQHTHAAVCDAGPYLIIRFFLLPAPLLLLSRMTGAPARQMRSKPPPQRAAASEHIGSQPLNRKGLAGSVPWKRAALEARCLRGGTSHCPSLLGVEFPRSWLHCALGARSGAAQGPVGGCRGVIERSGPQSPDSAACKAQARRCLSTPLPSPTWRSPT